MTSPRPLSPEAIGRLLAPFVLSLDHVLLEKLAIYLDLLERWNSRTNLTSIRTSEEIVSRHFGESLFASLHVPTSGSLLDFGSGAGFPGLPIALALPGLSVTFAESQNKKASFLREAVRVLGLSAEVWPKRVEMMPAERQFGCVTLRAVDAMASSVLLAGERASSSMVILTTKEGCDSLPGFPGFIQQPLIAIPASTQRVLTRFIRADVPHGTRSHL